MPVLQTAQTSINLPDSLHAPPCIRGNSALSHRPIQSSPCAPRVLPAKQPRPRAIRNDGGVKHTSGPSTAAFYILIRSHNKAGGKQVWAGGGEAINSDSGERRMEVIEGGGMKR